MKYQWCNSINDSRKAFENFLNWGVQGIITTCQLQSWETKLLDEHMRRIYECNEAWHTSEMSVVSHDSSALSDWGVYEIIKRCA